jgi:hypothetical protein
MCERYGSEELAVKPCSVGPNPVEEHPPDKVLAATDSWNTDSLYLLDKHHDGTRVSLVEVKVVHRAALVVATFSRADFMVFTRLPRSHSPARPPRGRGELGGSEGGGPPSPARAVRSAGARVDDAEFRESICHPG